MKKTLADFDSKMVEWYTHRVHQGALLLDKYETGWENKIDLRKLSLDSPQDCVLGQLFDDPVSIPVWKARGYKSLNEALSLNKDLIALDGKEKVVRFLISDTCNANYHLGANVLNSEFGTKIDRENNDASKLMIDHGFLEPEDEDEDRNDIQFYPLLDLVWTEEIKRRQSLSLLA